jgi:hypothetical protein
MRNNPLLRRLLAVLSFALLFSSGHIENPDSQLRLTQARLLVETGSLEIPKGFGDVTHGNIALTKSGKQYSVYNPGQIVLFVPFYWLAQRIPTQWHPYYVAAFLCSFLGYLTYGCIALVFWDIGKKLEVPERSRVVATLLFAGTSFCFAHAQDSYEHIYEALFVLLAVRLLLPTTMGYEPAVWAAVAIGCGLLFRTSVVIVLPGILVLMSTWRQRGVFLLTLVPFLCVLLAYNYLRFGDPFQNGYASAWALAFHQTAATSFKLSNLPKHLLGLLISSAKGLVFFSPSVVLAGFGYHSFWRHQPRLVVGSMLTVGAYLFFYAANFAWHGSAWNWGPRYIVPAVPLLYLAHFYLPTQRHRAVIAVVAAVSLVVQALAVSTFHKRTLVKTFLKEGDIFWSDAYFFAPRYSPLKGQVISLYEVSRTMAAGSPKELFLPDGPWRNEARPVSSQVMLDSGIDFTVYNFWWVRLRYLKVSMGVKLLGLGAAVIAALFLVGQFKRLWYQTGAERIG